MTGEQLKIIRNCGKQTTDEVDLGERRKQRNRQVKEWKASETWNDDAKKS